MPFFWRSRNAGMPKSNWSYPVTGILLLSCVSVEGQVASPGCIDAYQTMQRVNEEKQRDKADFDALHYSISQRTSDCEDLRELWLLRAELARLAGKAGDVRLSETRARDIQNGIDIRTIAAELGKRTGFDAAAPVRKRWGLVAGSSVFRTKDLDPLETADEDLTRMSTILSGLLQFDGVQTLMQEKFTLDNFRTEFASLRAKAEPEDLVVIYLATHALQPLDGTKDDDVSFLVLHDSNIKDSQQRYKTTIELAPFVQEVFREIKARRVILILDTCFSGDAITGQREAGGLPAPAVLETLTTGSGRVVIAAAGNDQQARELIDEKQGVFMYCFDRAIAAAPTGTLGELFAKVDSCVPQTLRSKSLPAQDPVMFAGESARGIVLGAAR